MQKKLSWLIGLIIVMNSLILTFPTVKGQEEQLYVGYIGREYSDWHLAPVKAALELDPQFNITHITNDSFITSALLSRLDVVIIQDINIATEKSQLLNEWINEGHALLVFCGSNCTSNPQMFNDLGIIEQSKLGEIQPGYTNALPGLTNSKNSSVITGFDWNAVPDIQNYTIFPQPDSYNPLEILVEKQTREDSVRLEKDPLIFYTPHGQGRVLIFASWLENGASLAFRGSPFFNYLIYSATITQAGMLNDKKSYTDWDYSPIPHPGQQIWFLLLIIGAVIVSSIIVVKAKRNSKHVLDISSIQVKKTIENDVKKQQEDLLSKPEGLISKPEGLIVKLEESSNINHELDGMNKEQKAKAWDTIGLHKQISGFFISLFIALLAAGPQIVLILFIYPRYIMPFPQAAGIYQITTDLFAAVWLVLDVGTSIALVTFFSAHRIERPEKAIHYIQIFIFWQLITGVIQFSIVAMLSLFVFPTIETYAYLSYHILIHSMIQFPGFLSVMLLTLRALQRSDLEQISNLLVSFVFKLGVAYLCVILFRDIFRDSVKYGEIFGAIVGLNMGAWIGNFADFGFSYFLFRRAGYSGKMLFRWDFTKEEVIEVLKYGIRLVMGNVWVPAVATLQAFLLIQFVKDYGSEMAYYQLASQIGALIALVGMYVDSLQAPISEAYVYKRDYHKEAYLGRIYVTTFKWVNILSFFLTSSLFVIGWRLILGFSGPTWGRAVFYLNAYILFQILSPYAWIGDKFFLGSQMPDMAMKIWLVEQGTRAIGLLIFIPLYGVLGILIAYFPALIAKDTLCILYIRRKIVAPPWYWWQLWIAPFIAAVINFVLLEFYAQLIWDGSILTSLVLFFTAIFIFLNVYSFLTGYLGAWDENELKELNLAVKISPKGLNLISGMIYFSARLGSRMKSPFVGRSKISLWEQAQVEMDELQKMKKTLTI
jgi:O-antigen/teichoic acid export membrane protein